VISPDEAQLALRDLNRRRFGSRSPTAGRARFPLLPYGAALRAIGQRLRTLTAARQLRQILRAPVSLQRPFDFVVWEAVPKRVACMV
jgi:hypothetical protein